MAILMILKLLVEKKKKFAQKRLGLFKFNSDNVIYVFIFSKPYKSPDTHLNPFEHLLKIWHKHMSVFLAPPNK